MRPLIESFLQLYKARQGYRTDIELSSNTHRGTERLKTIVKSCVSSYQTIKSLSFIGAGPQSEGADSLSGMNLCCFNLFKGVARNGQRNGEKDKSNK